MKWTCFQSACFLPLSIYFPNFGYSTLVFPQGAHSLSAHCSRVASLTPSSTRAHIPPTRHILLATIISSVEDRFARLMEKDSFLSPSISIFVCQKEGNLETSATITQSCREWTMQRNKAKRCILQVCLSPDSSVT